MDNNIDNSQEVQHTGQEVPAKSRIGVILLAIIVIVAAVWGAYFYLDSEEIEGRWNVQSAVVLNDDGSVNQTATEMANFTEDEGLWIEFHSDGTFRMGDISDELFDDYRWSVTEDKINIVDPWGGRMEWTYELNGDALTIDNTVFGTTLQMVLIRA